MPVQRHDEVEWIAAFEAEYLSLFGGLLPTGFIRVLCLRAMERHGEHHRAQPTNQTGSNPPEPTHRAQSGRKIGAASHIHSTAFHLYGLSRQAAALRGPNVALCHYRRCGPAKSLEFSEPTGG